MSGALTLNASWPLPQAAEIAGAYAQSYRAAFPGCNPDQPNSFMAVQARTHGIVGFALYLYQRSLADELMADTARTWLVRHGDQWGVPRLPARFAIGRMLFAGPANLPLPAGVELVGDGGVQWVTTAAAQLDAAGVASVPVRAETAGVAGNVVAAATLTIVSPIQGFQNQIVVVGPDGIAGGFDVEDAEAWRQRILLRIRKRGQAGAVPDYIGWAEDAGAASSPNVIASWVGPGSVAVVFALPNPAGGDRLVPTPAQVAAMQSALEAKRPVTAQVVALAAVQTVLPVTIALAADTVVNRATAVAAVAAYVAANPIGGLLDRSELQDAVLQAVRCGVELVAPAGNVQPGPTQMLVAGMTGFVGYA